MKNKDWLKIKKYTHLLPKLTNEDRPFIRSYVSRKSNIESHRFYPFIRYTIKESKWRRGRSKVKRHKYRSTKSKKRNIFYANHLDAQVFAYYNHLLSEKLENVYSENDSLSSAVVAYRGVRHDELPRNKSSIDFAKELFDNVKSYSDDCVVLCFDVVSFFDNLSHSILKDQWKNLLETTELPKHHYAVFKNITNFSYVELNDLFKEFSELGIKSRDQKKFRRIDSFCTDNNEFRKRVVEKGLVKNKKTNDRAGSLKKGIPQGSPISSVLSNLYMLGFDKKMANTAKENNEFYRRYSDDIVYVCPKERKDVIKDLVAIEIAEKLKLEISKPKLQEFIFSRESQTVQSIICYVKGVEHTNLKLQYLGFEYDGRKITIKNNAISRYYRKTKRLIRRKANYARRDRGANQIVA